MEPRYRHIFWDMGGTLVDTYPELDAVLAEVAKRHGKPVALSEVAALTRVSTDHAFRQLAERTGIPAAEFARANEELKLRWQHQPPPVMGGARKLIADVHAAGGLNLVVTHRDRTSARALVVALGLEIDDMLCAPDGYPRKPDPAMLTILLERQGLAVGECIVVGDRPLDAEAAAAAGMASALLVSRYAADCGTGWYPLHTLDDLRPLLHLEPR